MDALKHLVRRDSDAEFYDGWYGSQMGSLFVVLFGLVLLGSMLSLALLCLRRKRVIQRQQQQGLLPSYNARSHHRSVSMTNIPTMTRDTSVFVYDEKMNLIANSSSPPSTSVPQIRVTFPDDDENSQGRGGRVVVVHVTDTGSVGMSPLPQDNLPPYQRSDSERFQSLDLDRMGGLREKEPLNQRYS